MSLCRLNEACISRMMTFLNAGDLARLLSTGDSSLTYKMKRSHSLAIRFTPKRNKKRPTNKSLLASLIMDSSPLSELTLYSPSSQEGFAPHDVIAFVNQHVYTLKSLVLDGHHVTPFILPYMPELKTLQVDNLSVESRVTFAQVMPSLKSLVVGNRYIDPGVNPNMTNFHNLTTLHLGFVAWPSNLEGIVLPLLVSNFAISLDGVHFTHQLASVVRRHPTPFIHFAFGSTNWDWISGRTADTDLLRFIQAWQLLPLVEPLHAPSNNRLADWLSTNQLCSLRFDAAVKDESANASCADRLSSSSLRIRRGLNNRPDTKLGVSVCNDDQWSIPHVVPASIDPFGRKLTVMRIELLTKRTLHCRTLVVPESRDAYHIDHRALALNGFVIPHHLPRLVEPKTLVIRDAFGDFRLPFHCITHLDIGPYCAATETFMLPQTVTSLVIRTSNRAYLASNSICTKLMLCSAALESLTIYYDLPMYFKKPLLSVSDEALPSLKHVSVVFSGNKPHRKYYMWPRNRIGWPQRLETLQCTYEYKMDGGDAWAKINLSLLPPSVKQVDIKTVDAVSAGHILETTSSLPPKLILRLTNSCNNDLRPQLHDSATMWMFRRLLSRNHLFGPKIGFTDVIVIAVVLFVFWIVSGIVRWFRFHW